MSLWGKVIGFFTGGSKTAERVVDMADEAVHTSQEQSEADRKETGEARVTPLAPSHDSWFDVLVDGIGRLPRPIVIFYTFFGIIGLYPLPKLEEMNPYWATVFERILYFIFGSRFVAKDLPKLILEFRSMMKK